MYWGADDDLRARLEGPGPRGRRLFTAVIVTLLSLGGTVAMASAAPDHSGAAASPTSMAAISAATTSPPPPTAPATQPTPTTATTVHPAAPPAAPDVVATAAPVAAPAAGVPSASVHPAPAHPVAVRPVAAPTAAVRPAAVPGPDTCAAAVAYLAANSAPGFTYECPGYALGHQAMTCVNVAGVCPGSDLIVINVVCPASYMNEAHNSWILSGRRTGGIDPYGYCH